MQTTLHLRSLAESLILIPHALGFRPLESIVIACLDSNHEDENLETEQGTRKSIDGVHGLVHTPMGPMLVLRKSILNEGLSNSRIIAEYISENKIRIASICWFGSDLGSMVRDTETIVNISQIVSFVESRMEVFTRSGYRANIGVFATDFHNWVDLADLCFLGDTQNIETGVKCPKNFVEMGGFHPAFKDERRAPVLEIHDYREFETSEIYSELVFEGVAVSEHDKAIPSTIKDFDNPAFDVSRNAVALELDRLKSTGEFDDPSWVEIATQYFGRFNSGDECSSQDIHRTAAVLIHAMRKIENRDKIIVYALLPGNLLFSEIRSQSLSRLLDKASCAAPDNDKLGAVISAMIELHNVSPKTEVAPLAVIAYLKWWIGAGTDAYSCASLALTRDPDYSLAKLVEYAIRVQLPPPWV
ncbi:DUF4192 family protein [Arcanobacterium ihumii]|uniref:DUF4192 family protein n=1 Tax=Arcanobacterium ihumii TaxID=2138162 RepID=UPI001357DF6B|nr:DUF4192 family protein [Arcanobacterium ihumii]